MSHLRVDPLARRQFLEALIKRLRPPRQLPSYPYLVSISVKRAVQSLCFMVPAKIVIEAAPKRIKVLPSRVRCWKSCLPPASAPAAPTLAACAPTGSRGG